MSDTRPVPAGSTTLSQLWASLDLFSGQTEPIPEANLSYAFLVNFTFTPCLLMNVLSVLQKRIYGETSQFLVTP